MSNEKKVVHNDGLVTFEPVTKAPEPTKSEPKPEAAKPEPNKK